VPSSIPRAGPDRTQESSIKHFRAIGKAGFQAYARKLGYRGGSRKGALANLIAQEPHDLDRVLDRRHEPAARRRGSPRAGSLTVIVHHEQITHDPRTGETRQSRPRVDLIALGGLGIVG
jgi:hypothetical protein